MFLEDSAVLMTGIRDSIERSDRRALRDAAHKLKGSAANFHASALVEAAQRLETMADEGDVRWAANTLDALEKGMETLEQELLSSFHKAGYRAARRKCVEKSETCRT